MTTVLYTSSDNEIAWEYLAQARKHHTQAHLAQKLGVDIRTVRRWEARQTPIKAYLVPALQRLLPFDTQVKNGEGFRFIDLSRQQREPTPTDAARMRPADGLPGFLQDSGIGYTGLSSIFRSCCCSYD